MFIKSFNNNNDSNIIMLSKAKRTIKYRKFKKKISKKKDLKPKLDLERNSMKFNIYKKVLVLIFILIFAGGSIIFWLGKEQLDTMNCKRQRIDVWNENIFFDKLNPVVSSNAQLLD